MDTMELFTSYMKMVGSPSLQFDMTGPEELRGKSIGLIHGGAWMMLWGYHFSRKYLPGVKIVSIGNEAVQLNFMRAHAQGRPCPPERNIELFAEYARQLVELAHVDAIMVTCSTMNRSIGAVRAAVESYGIPVVQIDEPMMEKAVSLGGRTLVVATHGPTVENTKKLLRETAAKRGVAEPDFVDANLEEAFDFIGKGEIRRHNQMIDSAIRQSIQRDGISQVVLAQLSMSVFSMEHPDPLAEYGIPVLNSGDEGFAALREIMSAVKTR